MQLQREKRKEDDWCVYTGVKNSSGREERKSVSAHVPSSPHFPHSRATPA